MDIIVWFIFAIIISIVSSYLLFTSILSSYKEDMEYRLDSLKNASDENRRNISQNISDISKLFHKNKSDSRNIKTFNKVQYDELQIYTKEILEHLLELSNNDDKIKNILDDFNDTYNK